jgi:hypothetical protein
MHPAAPQSTAAPSHQCPPTCAQMAAPPMSCCAALATQVTQPLPQYQYHCNTPRHNNLPPHLQQHCKRPLLSDCSCLLTTTVSLCMHFIAHSTHTHAQPQTATQSAAQTPTRPTWAQQPRLAASSLSLETASQLASPRTCSAAPALALRA